MIRRPPRSTLFPTRRSSDLGEPKPNDKRYIDRLGDRCTFRSEEHTSELQSHSDLVCRLLLEKKKKKKIKNNQTQNKHQKNINKAKMHKILKSITNIESVSAY